MFNPLLASFESTRKSNRVKTSRVNRSCVRYSLDASSIERFSIDKCFPKDLKQLETGKIDRAFCSPVIFKSSQSFKSKSQASRYGRMFDSIFKLKHLLMNDPTRKRVYVLNFLLQFYLPERIAEFEESDIERFIEAIINFTGLKGCKTVKRFVHRVMSRP